MVWWQFFQLVVFLNFFIFLQYCPFYFGKNPLKWPTFNSKQRSTNFKSLRSTLNEHIYEFCSNNHSLKSGRIIINIYLQNTWKGVKKRELSYSIISRMSALGKLADMKLTFFFIRKLGTKNGIFSGIFIDACLNHRYDIDKNFCLAILIWILNHCTFYFILVTWSSHIYVYTHQICYSNSTCGSRHINLYVLWCLKN